MKGQWDDKVHEVHEQVAPGMPLYYFKDEDGQMKVIHHNTLLLIASEKGIPSCIVCTEGCLPLAGESSVMSSPLGEARELEEGEATPVSCGVVDSSIWRMNKAPMVPQWLFYPEEISKEDNLCDPWVYATNNATIQHGTEDT